jgi:hypothetical protein
MACTLLEGLTHRALQTHLVALGSGRGGDKVTWVACETLSAMAKPTSHFRCLHCGDLPRIHELNQKITRLDLAPLCTNTR